ncbi:MAG: methylmalonyl-CoA mutase [Flavobacteriales bacterium]|jgi:methylmalonyl-CoA mutase
MVWPKFNTSDFPPVSKEEWTVKALKDLKGMTLETLNWDSELGSLEPIFHPSDSVAVNELPPRSIHNSDNSWEITQSFHAEDSNAQVVSSLMQGTSYLNLKLEKGSEKRLESLLAGVHLEMIHLRVEGGADLEIVIQQLSNLVSDRNLDSKKLRGCLGQDLLTSNFNLGHFASEEELRSGVKDQMNLVGNAFPSMRSLPVQAYRYFEAGATNALELAIALHKGNTYLNFALETGATIDDISHLLEFKMSSGGSYFMNIAKFRALRIMWGKVVESYGPGHDCSSVSWIEAHTSERYYSSNDHYNNLLRATTSAMSAIVGSCDSIDVSNCSPSKQDNDELRHARNIHHLLREESWLDAVIDAGHGSYYIETLTNKLMTKAGELLTQVENAGGIWTPAGSEFIAQEMAANRTQILSEVANKERHVIGVNKFESTSRVVEKNAGGTGGLGTFNVPFELTKKGLG